MSYWFKVLLVICAVVNGARMETACAYDESVDGDISNNRLAPTQFTLAPGVNPLIGTTGVVDSTVDLEYFRIDLPLNYQLTAIIQRAYEADSDGVAFIGLQAGGTFTFTPAQANANIGSMLGYAHFGSEGPSPVGTDILDDIGRGPGSLEFTGPLEEGVYTFWLQQTGSLTEYQLDFIVRVIPEPSSAAIFLAALAALPTKRKRF